MSGYHDNNTADRESNKMTNSEMFEKSFERPSNYYSLNERQRWEIDDRLGILDWDGTASDPNGLTEFESERFYNHYDIPKLTDSEKKDIDKHVCTYTASLDDNIDIERINKNFELLMKAVGNMSATAKEAADALSSIGKIIPNDIDIPFIMKKIKQSGLTWGKLYGLSGGNPTKSKKVNNLHEAKLVARKLNDMERHINSFHSIECKCGNSEMVNSADVKKEDKVPARIFYNKGWRKNMCPACTTIKELRQMMRSDHWSHVNLDDNDIRYGTIARIVKMKNFVTAKDTLSTKYNKRYHRTMSVNNAPPKGSLIRKIMEGDESVIGFLYSQELGSMNYCIVHYKEN